MNGRWVPVKIAAVHVGLREVSLRRAIERNAAPADDGALEAAFDGIVARKVGRVWRVWLSARWSPRESEDAPWYGSTTGSARRDEE